MDEDGTFLSVDTLNVTVNNVAPERCTECGAGYFREGTAFAHTHGAVITDIGVEERSYRHGELGRIAK